MNYYNPYFSTIPYNYTPTVSTSRGLLRGLFGGGKLSTFINGTQKTLGIINQAIPIVKQISPVMKNAKTMFKVMNEFKKVETPIRANSNQSTNNNQVINTNQQANVELSTTRTNDNIGPTFFM